MAAKHFQCGWFSPNAFAPLSPKFCECVCVCVGESLSLAEWGKVIWPKIRRKLKQKTEYWPSSKGISEVLQF